MSKVKRYSANRIKGGMLAVEMFEELSTQEAHPNCVIEDRWRKRGTPQNNVVARYLPRLTNPDMVEGFTAILTEQLAHAFADTVKVLGYMEMLAKYPSAIANRKWDNSMGRRSRRVIAKAIKDASWKVPVKVTPAA